MPKNKSKKIFRPNIFLLVVVFYTLTSISVVKAAPDNSILTKPQQSAARKGNSYAKSNKATKAEEAYQPAIDQATNVEQCIALTKGTNKYGSVMIPVRRDCLNKALRLAKNQDDFFQIISCAREFQLYEITKESVDGLIAKAQSKDDLLQLARKAQSLSITDIAHLAMDKLYNQMNTSEEKIDYAKQAKLMGMEDLMRNAVKAAIDQEDNAHVLCRMISAIEPLEQPDLDRKILRKAVYQIKNVNECKEVYDTAKRLGQADILELAGYKGRKMLLMQQAQAEQNALNEQAADDETKRAEEEAKKAEAAQQAAQGNKNQPQVPQGPGF